jgi:5'(3')-deoxyribonucleotidase
MSEPSTFIIGVDLDGVCADYAAGLRTVRAAMLGVDEGRLPPAATWDFEEWGLDRAGFEDLHRTAVLEHRLFRNLPVMEGAAETLWRLSDAGAWVRVITHRLYQNWGHATAVSDTVTWLDEHDIPYRDLCFLGAKPEVEADVYVDDAPHNIEALRQAGNPVIVFRQPYNAHLPGPAATDWGEVAELVVDLMAAAGHDVHLPLPLPTAESSRIHHAKIQSTPQGRRPPPDG